MRPDTFASRQRPHIVHTESGYHAFVPLPLPPDLQFDHSLLRNLSAADHALGQLSGVGRTLPNPRGPEVGLGHVG